MTETLPGSMSQPEIENLLAETRTFPPDPAFVAQANAQPSLYQEAERDYVAFWEKLARERISWDTPFDKTLEWELPFAKWFTGGKLNLTLQLRRSPRRSRPRRSKVAYHWIGEPGDTRTITYADLQREVSKAANALRELGVKTGDVVAIYMPMIPELPIAMLACARLGAPHTVVFGGFSAEALAGRIDDSQAKLVITADGGWRRGKAVNLKSAADAAIDMTATVEHCLVVRRVGDDGEPIEMKDGRDVWWHDVVERQSESCPPVSVDSEHMLYLLYTSGHDGEAQGHHAYDGWLPAGHQLHPPDDLRRQARRRVLVRGGHRLGHRPLVHRLRAAGQRHDERHVRGRA